MQDSLKNFQVIYDELCAMYDRIPKRHYVLLFDRYLRLSPTDKAMVRAIMAEGHYQAMRRIVIQSCNKVLDDLHTGGR